jgi:aryl-alcohol dehydrogenase-like predicted oxidoreductase
MNYKLLGNSSLLVSELCLGTMTFGTEWGWGATQEESRKIFDSYAEAGGQFLDTANCYTDGTSERFLADFLAKDRTHFVLGTKYSLSVRRDDPNAGSNLGCRELGLRQDELQALDDASRIDLGFPQDLLAADSLRKILYGDTLPLLENHRWPGKRTSNAGLARTGGGK